MELLLKKGYIKAKQTKAMHLFVEYVLSLVINILVASAVGYTLEMENKMIVFSVFYTILRNSNGGNYLKLNLKNTVTIWGLGVACLIGVENIISEPYSKMVLLCMLAISILIVFLMVPFKAQKIDIPSELMKGLSKRSIITISGECIILVIAILIFNSAIVAAAAIGVFVQSVSLLPMPNQKRQLISSTYLAAY